MSHPALTPRPLTQAAIDLSPKAGYLLLLALLFIGGAAWAVPMFLAQIGLGLVGGGTFLALTLMVFGMARRFRHAQKELFRTVSAFVEHDAAPSFTTDVDGQIGYQNAAAVERFGGKDGETLISALGDLFASPPAAVLYRLQNKAQAKGAAREDVVLRRGHMRLSVHLVGGEDGYLWRLEDMGDRGGPAGRTGENISLPP